MEKKHYWKIVNRVINEADILLLILDARWVEETRNPEIEDKVISLNKPLIYVVTKCDLVNREQLIHNYRNKLNPSVFLSVKEHYGLLKLKERIMIEAKRSDKKRVTVGVLGYPNVGKSSVINMMKGKRSARTSPISGYTRGVQKIRSSRTIMYLDTPGVIPYKEKNFLKHVMTNVIDYTKITDPDLVVIEFMNNFPGRIENHYGVETKEDKEETIKEIAIKKNLIKKGGEPDIERMAIVILKDWQKGDIK